MERWGVIRWFLIFFWSACAWRCVLVTGVWAQRPAQALYVCPRVGGWGKIDLSWLGWDERDIGLGNLFVFLVFPSYLICFFRLLCSRWIEENEESYADIRASAL
jgi:hypothetical protein